MDRLPELPSIIGGVGVVWLGLALAALIRTVVQQPGLLTRTNEITLSLDLGLFGANLVVVALLLAIRTHMTQPDERFDVS